MDETEVPVLCSWKSYMNDGVYCAGPTPKVIKFKQNTKFTTFLDQLFLHTGLEKQRSKFDIICSYPSPVQESKVEYIPLPVVDDASLKTMLEIPSKHPCIEHVEVYMEVKSDEVLDPDVLVLCYWNGRIKCGYDGVHYEGSTHELIKVKPKTKLSTLMDRLYLLTGLDIDTLRSKVKIFGRHPSVDPQSVVTYLLLPVVDDASLETMLEVPRKHSFIKKVELYLEVKSGEVAVKVECESSQSTEVEEDAEIGTSIDSDMAELDVPVLFNWNGHIKCGCDGVHYEGSTCGLIKVKPKTKLSTLMDEMYLLTGLDMVTQKSKVQIFGRYPAVDPQSVVTYLLLPVVNDASLETMLEVPHKHSFIKIVELYLELNSDGVISPAACSSPVANPASCSKRQKTQQFSTPEGADSFVDTNMTHPPVNLEQDNGWTEDEPNEDIVNGSTRGCGDGDKNFGSVEVEHGINLTGDNGNAHKDSNAAKPRLMSSLWVDDYELGVGLCFKDRDELKKAVDWCSFRAHRKCDLQETKKDEYKFECIRWRCNWSLCAVKREEHGLVEITKYTGPHTCCPIEPEKFTVELAAEEIECLIRVQPTLTVAELESWWFDKFGYKLKTAEMKAAKLEVIKKLYGDWDQSFRVLPKLMSALHSSNGLVVDWQYDVCPNPEFASFRGVFWAFSQYIEGFQHCKPVIVVDTKDFDNGKYPMTLMIASGVDTTGNYFPLAFAVTKEVSVDSWRWFLTDIREKVTQREGICLISSPHPDILAVINEPGSLWKEPWAFHRFCIDHLSSKFHDVFQNSSLKSLMQQAGSTKQQDEFDSHMETIRKENPEARQWLDQMLPHQWALAHDGGRRYGVVKVHTEALFSVCESLWSRGLPVTAAALLLFDELKLHIQEGLCDSRGRLKRGDMYTTSVLDKLEEFRTSSITYVVMPLDNNAFQVTTPTQNDRWIVQLSECMCTCGDFQAYKFPCLHALAVCEKLRLNPLEYVDNYHSVEHFYRTYAATFSPVPQVSAWLEASGVPKLLPPVIPAKSQCKTTQESETSPKTYSKRKSTEKPTVEPSKSKEKQAPPSPTNSSCKSPIASSKRKKTEKPTKEQPKPPSKTKQARGKKKDKSKELPSDEELRNAIIDILKMVDFDTATFVDINKLLADKFKVDFTQRKTYIKSVIEAELTKNVDKEMSEENE